MSVLRRHPLVRADLSDAINWYEDQQPGLGLEFFSEFLSHYRHLVRAPEVWLLAVLHPSRDTEAVLAERRRQLRG